MEVEVDGHMSMRQTLTSNALLECFFSHICYLIEEGEKNVKLIQLNGIIDGQKAFPHLKEAEKSRNIQIRAHSIPSIQMAILNQQKSFSDKNRENVANKALGTTFGLV